MTQSSYLNFCNINRLNPKAIENINLYREVKSRIAKHDGVKQYNNRRYKLCYSTNHIVNNTLRIN